MDRREEKKNKIKSLLLSFFFFCIELIKAVQRKKYLYCYNNRRENQLNKNGQKNIALI
jgi:hypothetical protein